MKINSVEIESRLERIPRLVKKPMTALATSMTIVAFTGVPVLSFTWASHGGNMWDPQLPSC
jgi:hypothetical protein